MEKVWHTIPRLCGFFFCLFSPPKVDISSCTPFHGGPASWGNCRQAFSDKLPVSSIPLQVPTLCLDSMVSLLWLYQVKGVCMFRCNLGQNDCSLLRATAVTWGRSEYWNKSAQKVNLGEENFPPLLLGIRAATFWTWVQCSTNELYSRSKVKQRFRTMQRCLSFNQGM